MFTRSKNYDIIYSNISELKYGQSNAQVLYRRNVIWFEAYILTGYSAFKYNTKLYMLT